MEEAKKIMAQYLPEAAVEPILELIFSHKELNLKITNTRMTKLGDYRRVNKFNHRITVNHDLNPYHFLLTLLHEIAHFLTYKNYGQKVKPHGIEWKNIFGQLILDFLRPEIFPEELIEKLRIYAHNPKASTAGDGDLNLLLNAYNENQNPHTKYIFELQKGQKFALPNGQQYILQEKRRTRYKCQRMSNKKFYLIHKNAEVYPLD